MHSLRNTTFSLKKKYCAIAYYLFYMLFSLELVGLEGSCAAIFYYSICLRCITLQNNTFPDYIAYGSFHLGQQPLLLHHVGVHLFITL